MTETFRQCIRPWWRGVNAAVLSGGLILGSTGVAATTAQFTGGAGTDVLTGANWSGGKAPLQSKGLVVTFNGVAGGSLVTIGGGTYKVGKIQITAPTIGDGGIQLESSVSGDPRRLMVEGIDVARRASLQIAPDVTVAASKTLDLNAGVEATGSVQISSVTGGKIVVHRGTVVLDSANTYSGGTEIKGGELQASNSASLGTGPVTVTHGALVLSTPTVRVGGLILDGGQITPGISFIPAIEILGGGTIQLKEGLVSVSITENGPFTVTSVRKTGAGTVKLLAQNNYIGTTTLEAGSVEVGDISALGLYGGKTIVLGGTIVTSDSVAGATLSSDLTMAGNATLSGGTSSLTQSGSVDFAGGKRTVEVLGNVIVSEAVLDGGTSAGGIIKTGAGTLTLNGSGAYTGGTDINAGTIVAGNATALGTSGTVTVSTGGELSLGSGAVPVAVTVGALNVNGGKVTDPIGGSSIAISGTGAIRATAGVISAVIADDVGGKTSLRKTGAGALQVLASNTHSGNTKISGGVVEVGASNSLGSGIVELKSGTIRTADVADTGATLNSALSIKGNATLSGGTSSLTQSGAVDFAGRRRTVEVLGSVIVNGDVSDGGTSAGGIIKTGAGTLTLNGSGSYTGGTDINAGTIVAGTPTALGTSGTVTVSTGGELSLGSGAAPVTVGGLNVNGGKVAAPLGGGRIAISGGGAISATAGVISAVITDAVGSTTGLRKTGAGALQVLASNTYSGNTKISGGVVEVGASNSLGSGTVELKSGTIRTADVADTGATLNSALSIKGDVTISGGTSSLTQSGAVDFAGGKRTVEVLGNVIVSEAVLDGGTSAGGIIKTGAGMLTLNGSGAYTGGTDINAGTIVAGNATALGTSGTVTVSTGGELSLGSGAAPVTVGGLIVNGGKVTDPNGSGRIAISGGGTIHATAGVISAAIIDDGGETSLRKTGAGALQVLALNTYSGNTKISGGVVEVGASNSLGSGTVELKSGTIRTADVADTGATLSSALSIKGNATLSGGTSSLEQSGAMDFAGRRRTVEVLGSVIVNGDVSDGGTSAGGIIKTGAGTLTLNGVGYYTGGTDINAGTIVAGNAKALGTSGTVTVSTGGELSLSAPVGPVTVGGLIVNGGKVTDPNGSGSIAISGGGAIHATAGVISAMITDDGVVGQTRLEKAGSGTLLLSAANAYTGGTKVSAGVLSISNDEALGGGKLVLKGGTLRADSNVPVLIGNSISIAGTVTLDGGANGLVQTFQAAGTVDLAGASRTVIVNNHVTIESAIVDGSTRPGGIIKRGTGKLTITGVNNTYRGPTAIKSGILEAQSERALGKGEVVVDGGILSTGSRAIQSGSLRVNGLEIRSGEITGERTLAVTGTIRATDSGTVSASLADGSAIPTKLVKSGLGTLNLLGTNSYSGGTEIQTGVVVAAGTLGGKVVVRAGAALAPAGGTLTIKGALSGNGDYQWGRVSTGSLESVLTPAQGVGYQSIRVVNAAGSDLSKLTFKPVSVSAARAAIPVVNKTPGGDSFAYDEVKGINRYVGVIQGSGFTPSATPQFGGENTAVIKVSLVPSDPSHPGIDLLVERSSYSKFAPDQNGVAFGKYLDSSLRSQYDKTNELGALLRELDSVLSATEVRDRLRLSNGGASYASLYTTSVRRALAVGSTLDERLDALAAIGSPEGLFNLGASVGTKSPNAPTMMTPRYAPDEHVWTAWTAGYANTATIGAHSSLGDRITSDDRGATVGVERAFGNLKVGVLASFGSGNSNFEGTNMRVSGDHWTAGGYGTVAIGAVTVDASALWGSSDETSTRSMARAEFGTSNTQLGVGIAVNLLPQKSNWQVTPVARLKYVDYTQDAFAETGSGLLFKGDKVSESTLLSKLGLRVGHQSDLSRNVVLGIDAGAYWVHDFDASGKPLVLRVGGLSNSFDAIGRKSAPDVARLNIGVEATFSNTWTVRLSGQQDEGVKRSQTSGLFSVSLSF